ncbi:MAG TPA: hypothetical protein VIC56_06035 [Gemmatimonadota bacterium]
MSRLDLSSLEPYVELRDWSADAELRGLVAACVRAQRDAAEGHVRETYRPDPEAAEVGASEAALQALLAEQRDVHGISTERHISNVVLFNSPRYADSVRSAEVVRLRRRVDAAIARRIRRSFRAPTPLTVTTSGHFWYPPGGYMAWHTNSGRPGWRMYVVWTDDPGRSFFRYRDPRTGAIVTSFDTGFDVRLFEIRADRPLWHAIRSDTHRFSLGYVVRPTTRWAQLREGLRRRLGR